MRVLRYAGMPDARSDKAASSGRKETTRTDQEYLDLLAKEFNSIPDRESAPQETQDEDQLAAMSQTSSIKAKPDKESTDQRNVQIAKTIRSAMAGMKIGR